MFSTLVAVTARHLPAWTFHVYYALLLGAYAAAMLGLFVYLADPELARRRWPVFCLLFLAAHAALPRWLSYEVVHFDYPWFLQAGVAGQYLLGAMLQPSSFGVLLVIAVAAFAWERPYLAAVLTGAGGVLHSTYLLPGALLTLGFLAALVVERRWRTAVASGSLALAVVAPAVAYLLLRFGPTTPEAFAEAQDILVNVRIPHHSRVDLWLDWVAGLQIAWVVGALPLAWRTRLFLVLAVPFTLSAALTAWQAATGSQALALLFPWRVSAVLVPLATTVILSRLVALPWPGFDGLAARTTAFAGAAALVLAGVWIMATRLGFHSDPDEVPVMEYVRAARSPGDLYLLPVRVPDSTKRGSLSSDFKPLPAKKQDAQIIPVDLQRFRLSTGAPVFVDFKSIPYKDTDVIEWRDRLRLAQALNDVLAGGRAPLSELRRLGITHVVRPTPVGVALSGLEKAYGDEAYEVYRVPLSQRRVTAQGCGAQ
ncbi:MAG: DUF6798 domain-containing protein [Gemmataceae bacterium]